jgi:heterodisulfide reductase subunit A-like polyferredoxin/coenzyme F420-reducing hydrogenase delta subunit
MKQGLFFSTCDGQLSEVLDFESLAEEYASLESVKVFDNFYQDGSFDELMNDVESKDLHSLILAGESPMAYRQTRNGELLFKCLEERGLNPNRVEVVNLKNMVVRPHQESREALQQKAKLLIDVGLEKVKVSPLLKTREISPRQSVAIIGANSSSVAVAQHLLDEGYKVFLVQDGTELSVPKDESQHMQPTLAYVKRHARFTIHNEATVTDFHGYTGDYVMKVAAEGTETEMPVGAVVLSLEENTRMIKKLQPIFHVDIDEKGALAAKDEKTARSQTQDRGIFVVNPVQADGNGLGNRLLAADGTAAMVINLLNRKEIYHRVAVSQVDKDLCGGCGSCVKTCMFHAVSLEGESRVSVIDPRRCRGCGNCVTACPAGARDLVICPTTYLFNAVDILSSFQHSGPGKKILAIACDGCGYRCLDRAGEQGLSWPVGIMPLWVVCGGQIDTQLIMYAFVKGFDGVALLICGEGCCHNLIGNVDLERRANLLKEILASRGIDHGRMQIISTCSRNSSECVDKIGQFSAQLGDVEMSTSTVMLK